MSHSAALSDVDLPEGMTIVPIVRASTLDFPDASRTCVR